MALRARTQLIDRLTGLASSTPDDTLEATSDLWAVVSEQQAKDDPVARILGAVTRVARENSSQSLRDVLGAPSDYAVLLRLLSQPESLSYLVERDPLAAARLRGLGVRERLLAVEGGAITSEEAGQVLGVTRQAIDNRRKRGTLLAVPLGRRGYRYPAWQFGPDGVLPGLDRVLKALGETGPWTQMVFMLNGNAWLDDRRPLDALRAGEIDAVVMAASQYGEQSAA
jgi:hypothetical protein